MPFQSPWASRSSMRNNDSPRLPLSAPSGRASASAMSEVAADVNHLVPCNDQLPSALMYAAVAVALTSEPPVFSVIHCPDVHAFSRAVSLGT